MRKHKGGPLPFSPGSGGLVNERYRPRALTKTKQKTALLVVPTVSASIPPHCASLRGQSVSVTLLKRFRSNQSGFRSSGLRRTGPRLSRQAASVLSAGFHRIAAAFRPASFAALLGAKF